jgi:poly(ADP-ribose) glycohydrolase ARH3
MVTSDIESRFVGTLLGLALGDALGAPFEGGIVERGLWRLIGKTRDNRMRWTDDTQMTLDLAESLLACGRLDQDDVAQRFARGYRWSRGYGPGAARVLKLIRRGQDWRAANTSVFPEGSFGNGGAMRAPVIGLFCANQIERLEELARASAVVTHAHPIAQDGAVIIARATVLALEGRGSRESVELLAFEVAEGSMRQRLEATRGLLERDANPQDAQALLGNGMLANESCVTAIYIALRFLDRSFLEMLQFVAECGGDVDTIGAMAGAIWGARNGESSLPTHALEQLERAEYIRETAIRLNALSAHKHGTA